MRLRLDIAYDGTAFSGWAKQPDLRTVQGELETAIAQVLRLNEHAADEHPQLTVAGRTDAGVHARGQVAHLDVTDEQAAALSARRLNSVLGSLNADDVVVIDVTPAPAGFDARFSPLFRRYEYRVADSSSRPDPLQRTSTVSVNFELDQDVLSQASASLLGLRDFSTFCKAREGATAVRTLERFDWRRDDRGVFVATLQADAFCHSMVRALVGAVIAVASGRITLDELSLLVEARQRSSAFTVMPAHGLSLEEIGYPPDSELAARAEQTRARRSPLDS